MSNNQKSYCPYRTRSVVYHNNSNNMYLPDVGIHRKIDHDIIDTNFKPCIQEKCMLYDRINHICTHS